MQFSASCVWRTEGFHEVIMSVSRTKQSAVLIRAGPKPLQPDVVALGLTLLRGTGPLDSELLQNCYILTSVVMVRQKSPAIYFCLGPHKFVDQLFNKNFAVCFKSITCRFKCVWRLVSSRTSGGLSPLAWKGVLQIYFCIGPHSI